jgi:gamma-glutamylcyclotransferase (GGCT)/AIG2-like uncharacterized protein YtfP
VAEREFLFVYGTLQPGFAPPEMEPVVARMRVVGEGFVLGRLYSLGRFPGLVMDAGSGLKVFGVVMELPEDRNILAALDAYEEFYADEPKRSQFLRVQCAVSLHSGRSVACWVYVYNGGVEGARVIADGRFVLPLR